MYNRCVCGKTEVFGSLPVPPCERCPSCGSNLAGSPAEHVAPSPHQFKREYGIDRDTGHVTAYRECQLCGFLEPVPIPACDQ